MVVFAGVVEVVLDADLDGGGQGEEREEEEKEEREHRPGRGAHGGCLFSSMAGDGITFDELKAPICRHFLA